MSHRSEEFEMLEDDLTPEQRQRRAEILRRDRPEVAAHDATLDLSTDDVELARWLVARHRTVYDYLADR